MLRFALISEGRSDAPLVDHLRALCRREAGPLGVDVVEGIWANPRLDGLRVEKDVESRVRAVVADEESPDLIFIHRDADARDDQSRRQEIARAIASVNPSIRHVPVVPIQETEAWLLVDEALIRMVVGNAKGKTPLDLPKIKHIEKRADPKEILRLALSRAAGQSMLSLAEFGRYRRVLFERLDIDGSVNQLSSWQNLIRDLRIALAELVTTTDFPCPPSTRS